MRTPSVYSQDDPITAALQPPPTETEQQRYLRLEAEANAKRVSEQIDEDLKQERERLKRKKDDIKVARPVSVCAYTNSWMSSRLPSAASPRSGREWKVYPAKAVPAHVQAQFTRSGTHFLENCHLL